MQLYDAIASTWTSLIKKPNIKCQLTNWKAPDYNIFSTVWITREDIIGNVERSFNNRALNPENTNSLAAMSGLITVPSSNETNA